MNQTQIFLEDVGRISEEDIEGIIAFEKNNEEDADKDFGGIITFEYDEDDEDDDEDSEDDW